jgi:hypothetical protein
LCILRGLSGKFISQFIYISFWFRKKYNNNNRNHCR